VTKDPGSILKIEKVNFVSRKQAPLFGYAISAKRYALFGYDKNGNIVIVDAKAHGSGYLYHAKRQCRVRRGRRLAVRGLALDSRM
jgi:hypothetical protein